MDFYTVKEIADIWGIQPRMVMIYCATNRIPGAEKRSGVWHIPLTATKPIDGRSREAKAKK